MEMLNSDKSQANNIGKNNEKKDEENINVFIADLYSYAIAIMYIYWKG